ncbi:atrial natriuretic peptide receptor 2-like [Paramacrobiotus metropolitanus]|uniref:atrial natriuretic peptide receptor 2-like n=1 Tax=Paramacrobiotus metropolitanus TaxID=2943436 RepID=UPI0024461804|nr:atrial natriuretic peptide receptor 2-like [Paramacrobiotus metropolitanus]
MRLNVITLSNANASGSAADLMQSTFAVALRHNQQRYPELYENFTKLDLSWPADMPICRPVGDAWVPLQMAKWYSHGMFNRQGVTVVLSSVCAYAFPTIADFLRELDIAVLPCATSVAIRRDRYTTAVTMSTASFILFGQSVWYMMKKFNWRYVVIIRDEFKRVPGYVNSGRSQTQCEGVTMDLSKRTDVQYQLITFDSTAEDFSAYDTLRTAASYSRIIVCCTLFKAMRRILAAAAELNMTNGEYVSLAFSEYFYGCIVEKDPLGKSAYQSTISFAKQEFLYFYEGQIPAEPPLGDWRQNDDLDKAINAVIERVLVIRTPETDWSTFLNRSDEILRYREAVFGAPYDIQHLYNDFFVSCTNAADLMSTVLDEFRTGNETEQDSPAYHLDAGRILKKLLGQSYRLPFENVSITSSGEKVPVVVIQQFDRVSGKFRNVYAYNYLTKAYDLVDVSRPIKWKLGVAPLDRPVCDTNCSGLSSIIPTAVGVAVAGIVLVVGAAAGLLRRQQKLDKRQRTWWMVSETEFMPFMPKSHSSDSFTESASWSDVTALRRGTYRSTAGQLVNLRGSPAWKQRLYWTTNAHPVLTTTFLKLVSTMHKFDNCSNLNSLLGICFTTKIPSTFYTVCKRGSIEDMITQRNPDWNLKLFLIQDIIRGLTFLHKSSLKKHGNLKGSKCLLDKQMVIKISDYGHEELSRSLQSVGKKFAAPLYVVLEPFFAPHCWMAPEVLRGHPPTPESDVYALGLIAHQIIMHTHIYGQDGEGTDSAVSEHILEQIAAGSKPYFRPLFPQLSQNRTLERLIPLVQSCWAEEPSQRPQIAEAALRFRLATASEGMEGTFLDRIMQWLEKYNRVLEQDVADRTALLLHEQKKADELLCQMLPASVVKKLRTGETVEAEYVEEVSILFCDISGFNTFVASCLPQVVLSFLHEVYSIFDEVSVGLSIYKLETIGSNYVAVSGLLERIGSRHADEICRLATVLLSAFERVRSHESMQLLMGVHSGPVAAGVIGLKRPRYCFFGDSVNTAARMQTSSQPSQVHVSVATVVVAQQFGHEFISRGKVHLKGKGNVTTYWLLLQPEQHVTSNV